MTEETVAFIFARGGSKGLPGKNIRPLDGRPLIAWSIEAGLSAPSINRVVVSTDSEEIADAARKHGAEVPFMRPADLATDEAPEWLAWRHAVTATEEALSDMTIGTFVSLPTVAPLRTVKDIEACLTRLREGRHDVVFTVARSDRNPFFSMVTMDEDGTSSLAARPDHVYARRQDAPTCYDIVPAVYVTTPRFILEHENIWEGTVGAVEIPKTRAVDIDSMVDFLLAEAILKARKSC